MWPFLSFKRNFPLFLGKNPSNSPRTSEKTPFYPRVAFFGIFSPHYLFCKRQIPFASAVFAKNYDTSASNLGLLEHLSMFTILKVELLRIYIFSFSSKREFRRSHIYKKIIVIHFCSKHVLVFVSVLEKWKNEKVSEFLKSKMKIKCFLTRRETLTKKYPKRKVSRLKSEIPHF